MRTDDAAELRTAADAVAAAAQLLAPFLYDPGVTGAIRDRLDIKDLDLWVIPCVLPTVAEIIMAGVDGRPTDCVPRVGDDGDYPPGKSALPSPPEAGIAPTWEPQAKSVRDAIERKFNSDRWKPGDWPNTRRLIDDFMYVRFAANSAGASRTKPQRIAAAAIELELSATDRHQTYYLFVPLPTDADARTEAEEALRALGRDYPALAVLGYEDDGDQENRDRQDFGPFAKLLPKRS